jgi:hypothetical protein
VETAATQRTLLEGSTSIPKLQPLSVLTETFMAARLARRCCRALGFVGLEKGKESLRGRNTRRERQTGRHGVCWAQPGVALLRAAPDAIGSSAGGEAVEGKRLKELGLCSWPPGQWDGLTARSRRG